MSEESRNQALQHLKKAESQIERRHYGDALLTLNEAKQLANEAQSPDILASVLETIGKVMRLTGRPDEAIRNYKSALDIQEKRADQGHISIIPVATTRNNLGTFLVRMGRIDEAEEQYEGALRIFERLLESNPDNVTYQSSVAANLDNLGNFLARVGRIKKAYEWYEDSLKMRERLLKGDSENVTYQSDVATTMNNLGALLSDMGRIDEAKDRYEGALGIYTEPMQYMTILAKLRTIINIIQLVSRSAEEETNRLKKPEHFREVYTVYGKHKEFFTSYNLEYAHRVVREVGLSAHIQYLMLNAEAEDNTDKRTDEYARCVQEIKKIAETDDDEGLRELLLSVMHYFEGRRLINEAIKSDPPDKKLTECAVEKFKLAKDRYN